MDGWWCYPELISAHAKGGGRICVYRGIGRESIAGDMASNVDLQILLREQPGLAGFRPPYLLDGRGIAANAGGNLRHQAGRCRVVRCARRP